MKRYQHRCERCSTEFIDSFPWTKFCSFDCRKPLRNCANCGSETRNRVTCNKKCTFEWQLKSGCKLWPAKGSNSPNWNPDRRLIRERKAMKSAHFFIRGVLGRFANHPDEIVPEIGYSPRMLKEHLESQFQPGMNWENHAQRGWHIDHIRPISSFPPGTPLSEINDLKNLRPLWYKENLAKGSKWICES